MMLSYTFPYQGDMDALHTELEKIDGLGPLERADGMREARYALGHAPAGGVEVVVFHTDVPDELQKMIHAAARKAARTPTG